MLTQLQGLALSLAIEAPLILLASRKQGAAAARRLAAALLPSCLTHPWAWHAIGNFGAEDYATGLFLIEAIVFTAESLLIWRLLSIKYPQSLALSLLANSASFSAGYLLLRVTF